jgi:hypothetical protein
MKSLVETLNESLNINESKETMLRFEFGDLEHADETIKSIEDLANKNSVYSEKIDGGIKIKVNDSNKDKLDSIQDVLQQYVQKMQDDDKADQDDVKSLANQLDKLSDFIESEDDDKEDKENKEDKEDNEEGE